MAPSKAQTSWDDEDSDSSSGSSSSPAAPVIARRSKFDDEEDESDVLDDWENEEDSEVEREKAKKAAEAKAKAEAEAKANHKPRKQRIEDKIEENRRRRAEEDLEDDSEDDETEAEKRARLRSSEKESDLAHAEDLFGGVGGVSNRRAAARPVTVQSGDGADPADAIDLSSLKLFNPATVQQFAQLRETLVPLVGANAKKPQYAGFMQELAKQLVKEMSSDQVKKVASALSTISNEKMKEEKAAEKGGKKTKAAKTKATLSANRDVSSRADTTAYEDGLDDGDFM